MSEILQAIDLVWKLIPQLKSLTGVRRRECFDKVIAPLFASFEDIHEFYNALFLSTRRDLVDEAFGENNVGWVVTDSELSLKQIASLEKIKKKFVKERERDEYLRDGLRQDAKDVLLSVSWTEERRFLVSIGNYFLGRGGVAPTDHNLDEEVKGLIENGGDSYWDTPSSELYVRIREERDVEKVIELLDKSRNDLNQRYMNVRLRFKQAQLAIISKT